MFLVLTKRGCFEAILDDLLVCQKYSQRSSNCNFNFVLWIHWAVLMQVIILFDLLIFYFQNHPLFHTQPNTFT